MGKEGDCGCGSKVKVVNIPRPGNAAHATGGSSLVQSLVRAAEILGGDTRAMANSEVVDALCDALVIAREEKQALAEALDKCHEEMTELEEEIADQLTAEGQQEWSDDDEEDDTEVE